ncbi:MAG TPA: hypothetical protein PLK90_04940 [Clostridiales bacterium]|jgi:hypothetical protein|nr:hypothetical protein [Clostridiales bacterium]HQP69729.1 hypothetical protein [Clostridiales bacterium]
MEELNIPKLRKEVEIAFKDGGIIKITKMILFLNKFSAYHSGEETVLEVLNDRSKFIPAMIPNGQETFAILNVDSIFYVTETDQDETQMQKEDLCIQFITGEKMEFKIHEELPGNRSRAVDFLNSERLFLTFLRNNHKVYINKNKINKVEVL